MAIVGGNYSFGDFTDASNQIASALNNLDADSTSNFTTMIRNANTAWDTNLGSETTTSMKDYLDKFLTDTISSLNDLKNQFDSIASGLAEKEHFSFSPGSSVEHSGHIQGGDIKNASDVNGSYNPDGVSQALNNGTNSAVDIIRTAEGRIAGLDLGMHADLQKIAQEIVDTIKRKGDLLIGHLDEWNDVETQKQDKSGEAYAEYVNSCISEFNAGGGFGGGMYYR